jgi:hypothetical protein
MEQATNHKDKGSKSKSNALVSEQVEPLSDRQAYLIVSDDLQRYKPWCLKKEA